MTQQNPYKMDVEMCEYVVCNLGNHLLIVGPFVNRGNARDWGEEWQQRNNDNPNWQCTTLMAGKDSISIVPPIVTSYF